MYSFLNDWGIVLGLFWYNFGIVLGSILRSFLMILVLLWYRFGIILGSSGVAIGGRAPMSLVLRLEPLGGSTRLKDAQMFVVGAALALGGGPIHGVGPRKPDFNMFSSPQK